MGKKTRQPKKTQVEQAQDPEAGVQVQEPSAASSSSALPLSESATTQQAEALAPASSAVTSSAEPASQLVAATFEEPVAETQPHAEEECDSVYIFRAAYDADGVYVYQAFNSKIAKNVVKHQSFKDCRCGGFNPKRMTWVKPSFAWMLCRSGYGRKEVNQERILKIRVSHKLMAEMLEQCRLAKGGGSCRQPGRVQWDPEYDLWNAAVGRNGGVEPQMLGPGAIQIGVAGPALQEYMTSKLQVEDVTDLAHQVGNAHGQLLQSQREPNSVRQHGGQDLVHEAMVNLKDRLPVETKYVPLCSEKTLQRLDIQK